MRAARISKGGDFRFENNYELSASLLPCTPGRFDTGGGPTPSDRWPIRVFGWMVDNRKWFWTQREKDQGAAMFVGDSLAGNWKGEEMAKAFPKLKVANRGIGGDVSRDCFSSSARTCSIPSRALS